MNSKRKSTAGGSETYKRKKDAEVSGSRAGEPAKQSPNPGGKEIREQARGLGVNEVFCIVEVDGTAEDSKVWGPTLPMDMRRWLPPKMVALIQASLTLEEWRAKAKWMVAYIFVRVQNFSNEFVNALLLCYMPQRDNIVDTRTESTHILEYMAELQTVICGQLEQIANRWIRGKDGQKYIAQIRDSRRKNDRRRRLTIKEIEEYFEFTVEDYSAIWFPISFVLDPEFWNPTGPGRLDYEELRMATLAMICRIVVVLLTGKIRNRVLSNNMRIRILDSTCSEAILRPWPSMISSAGRPDGTSAWEEESPRYPEYKDSPMYQHLWERIDPPERAMEVVEQNESIEVGGLAEEIHGGSEPVHQRVELVGGGEKAAEAEGGGGPGMGGFVSLERVKVEDLTISRNEVQGLINDVEAQLVNVQRTEVQEDTVEPLRKHIVEQHEDVYETDEGVSVVSDDEVVNIPMSMGSKLNMRDYHGLLTMEILGELDDYRRDDSKLDRKIQELLRPTPNEEDLRSIILNQAVKLTLLGPLGMARWNIEACLEIVRRCEDLYLLIDKKIKRTEHIIKKLQSAAVSASDSVERLDVLRGMLGKKVEKLNKAKQEKQKAEVQARMQREQGIMCSIAADTGARGRRGGFETPTKTGGVAGRNATSVMRDWTVEKKGRKLFRTSSGVSADGSCGEDMSPSQTIGPASPDEGVVIDHETEGIGEGKDSDMPYGVANRPTKGNLRSGWNDQTVDDDDLRLGN